MCHLCFLLSPFSALLPPGKAFLQPFTPLSLTFGGSQLAPPTPSDSQASFTPEKS